MTKPFLKWVGGKRQLLPLLLNNLPTSYNSYYEPFLGGGALFFSLNHNKDNNKDNKVYINDLNKELINCYQVVKDQVNSLKKRLEDHENSKEYYMKIRGWDRHPNSLSNYDPEELASRFLYLNANCFNAVYRVNKKGEFNVPMGKRSCPINWDNVPGLQEASDFLNNIKNLSITSLDFEEVLKSVEKDDFVYLDPPYDVFENKVDKDKLENKLENKSKNFTGYTLQGFGRNEQIRLKEVICSLDKKGAKFMMSNHDTPFIREAYKDFSFIEVNVQRCIGSKVSSRNLVPELLIKNY